MKYQPLLLTTAAFLCALPFASAQMVGDNIFLKGNYVEAAQNKNGSFGACVPASSVPAGYHPHSSMPTSTTQYLAMVADPAMDGWAVGTPAYMGDYTYSGFAYEGWEIQVNGARGQAFQDCSGNFINTSGSSLMGTNVSTATTAGGVKGTWIGTAAGGQLTISMETSVNTGGLSVDVNVKLRNTGFAPLFGVYYYRGCDPDVDQTWSGSGFTTFNKIVHQNDSPGRVLVTARGTLPGAYMGLGTIDTRAMCFIHSDPTIGSTIDLAHIWDSTFAGLTGPVYVQGATDTGDHRIGLVFKIGTIPAGDSASFSYSYFFSDGTPLSVPTFRPAVSSIYPNPATDELTIKTPGNFSSFTITNSIGQTIMQQTLSNNVTTVSVKPLPPGLYIVSLDGDQGREVMKFLKR